MRAFVVAVLTLGVITELVLRAVLLIVLTAITLTMILATPYVPAVITLTLLPVLRKHTNGPAQARPESVGCSTMEAA